MALDKIKERISAGMQGITGVIGGRVIATGLAVIVVLLTAAGIYWSSEPAPFFRACQC